MEIKFDSFFEDVFKRKIRFSWERKSHIERTIRKCSRKRIKFRKLLGEKYLCVVVKNKEDDNFIITSYFTNTLKKGNYYGKRYNGILRQRRELFRGNVRKKKKGYFKETANDAVMEKVDENGAVIGFSILNVSALHNKPLEVSLDYNVA